jgi:hypothetical protein
MKRTRKATAIEKGQGETGEAELATMPDKIRRVKGDPPNRVAPTSRSSRVHKFLLAMIVAVGLTGQNSRSSACKAAHRNG